MQGEKSRKHVSILKSIKPSEKINVAFAGIKCDQHCQNVVSHWTLWGEIYRGMTGGTGVGSHHASASLYHLTDILVECAADPGQQGQGDQIAQAGSDGRGHVVGVDAHLPGADDHSDHHQAYRRGRCHWEITGNTQRQKGFWPHHLLNIDHF